MEPLVDAFGYRNVRVEGYEADDVIASLAQRALQADPPVPVMIVTGDRDVFQLIDERGLVKVMATARGITDTKIYDRQAVIDRYGIPPELIPDFYGLKGDTSDNIPGVPGIGDKTASELIQQLRLAGAGAGQHRSGQRAQAQTESRAARRGRARVDEPGDRAARRGSRLRHRDRGHPRARPLEGAGVLPRVRVARPAAAPGGGARRPRRGSARAGRRADAHCARARRLAGRRGAPGRG